MGEFTPRGGSPGWGGGKGTVPPDLAERAAEIYMQLLGFEEPEEPVPYPACMSRLMSTGESNAKPRTAMPVDVFCFDKFRALSNKTRWVAFPANADGAIRVPEVNWKSLLRCLLIPPETN